MRIYISICKPFESVDSMHVFQICPNLEIQG